MKKKHLFFRAPQKIHALASEEEHVFFDAPKKINTLANELLKITIDYLTLKDLMQLATTNKFFNQYIHQNLDPNLLIEEISRLKTLHQKLLSDIKEEKKWYDSHYRRPSAASMSRFREGASFEGNGLYLMFHRCFTQFTSKKSVYCLDKKIERVVRFQCLYEKKMQQHQESNTHQPENSSLTVKLSPQPHCPV